MARFDPRAWPIRWRLTALNVGVLTATLIALGLSFLLLLDNALIGITADHLRDQARPILIGLHDPRGATRDRDRSRTQPGLPSDIDRIGGLPVARLTGPDTGVGIYDATGTLIAQSEDDEDDEGWPAASPAQVQAALAGSERTAVVQQQTRRTLILLLPIRNPSGNVAGVLQVSGSLELIDQLEARLRTFLIIGTLLAVVVAGTLGVRATRQALRPLDRVIQAARRIEAGQLDERLRLNRRDEVGELAEAFDHMLDRLAAAIQAQRRFVADAAHELRTPLTALGGMVELLQLGADRGDKPTVRKMLATMEREIDRLGRLVADLLTLSRLDAETPLAREPVDLAALVSEVAHQIEVLARGQTVRVRIEPAPQVLGDADRLKQVLLNLGWNALAFTPPTGFIELGVSQAGDKARLTVEDSGSGIAPDVLPRVMDRFVRGDPSRTRATGGSGLGLAIAREIVEAHGGTLRLESELGRGTLAIVELPGTGAPPVPQPAADDLVHSA